MIDLTQRFTHTVNTVKKHPHIAAFRAGINRHSTLTVIICLTALFITCLAMFTYFFPKPAPKAPAVAQKVEPPKPKYYSPLTGREVPSQAATKQPVTAIMIENSPDARPQSGLKDAGVVYEAIAEGGITRFLAVYQEAKPELIGPVRSLRPYYLDWATPYNATIAHIGGSQAALQTVRSGNFRDLDEFFNTATFWRATDRYAPHNVYTNFQRLDAANQKKGWTSSEFVAWPRAASKPSATPNATAIRMNISGPEYNVSYTYDSTSNSYVRSVGGALHRDREAGTISPNIVVGMMVQMGHVFEDGYRESIDTSSSGVAYIFQNGTFTEGSWRKASREAPLELLDANAKQIILTPGQTWVTAVPTGSGGVSWE